MVCSEIKTTNNAAKYLFHPINMEKEKEEGK